MAGQTHGDAGFDHNSSALPPNSHQRAPTRLKGGRSKKGAVGGKLAALSEFPLDVMYEIFCYLHPAQLLAISRTNKTLRDALLRNNARWIWKASFKNVKDIPEPPTDINEPQYARLLFDKSCMFCLAINGCLIAWEARLRFCRRCMQTEFIRFADLPVDKSEPRILSFIIGHIHFFSSVSDGTRLYPRAQVEKFVAGYNRVRDNEAQATAWLADQLSRYRTTDEHGGRLKQWTDDSVRRRWQTEDDEIRRTRIEFIHEKLREIGWGDELQYKDSLRDLNKDWLLKTPQRLTHRGWKTIEKNVIARVQAIRTKRLERKRESALRASRDSLAQMYEEFLAFKPLDSVFPIVGDLLTIDHIHAAIEDTPIDHNMPWGSLRRLFYDIPQSWLVNWREKADAALVDVLSRDLRRPVTVADLSLASTHFILRPSAYVNAGGYVKTYPDVLADASVVARVKSDDVFYILFSREYWPWSPARLKATRYHRRLARALVSLAGYDPDTTTRAEMELHDPWFVSYPDSSDSQRMEVMRWPYVMSEIVQKNIKKLSVLSEEDTAYCRWEFRRVGLGNHSGDSVCCRLCQETLRSWQISNHLHTVHRAECLTTRHYATRRAGCPALGAMVFTRENFITVGTYTFPDASNLDADLDSDDGGHSTGTTI
ncbi:hypothetical protein BD626DRAFT_184913 [Schizophyllum amplum]|uniref:F-box domain-containing protein n=1 Tax=Schizophyllum amplum TaxID=97359 RepID=A0A550C0Q2_9AGAR|nr:hypothetical protein BD626DRAFT_184913 [Auriculariopsis ampla]